MSNPKTNKQTAEEVTRLKKKIIEIENRLSATQDFYSAIINSIEDTLFYKTLGGAYQGCNTAFARVTGKDQSKITGKTDEDLFSRDEAEIYREGDRIVLETGKPYISSEWITQTDGRRRLLETHKTVLKNSQNEVIGIIGISRDKTEHEQALKSLTESEELNRSVVAALAEGIVIQKADGEIINCNASAEQILGLTRDQMMRRISVGYNWRTIHEDGSPFPRETHPTMVTLRTGKPCTNVIMGVYKPDGAPTWISVNTQPLFRNNDAEPYAVVASFIDITRLKSTECELRESEEKHRLISSISSDYIYSVDLRQGMRLTWISGAFEQITGYTAEEINNLPKKWFSIVHPDDLNVTANLSKEIWQGKSNSRDYRIFRKDGNIKWINDKFLVTYTDDGAPFKLYGSVKDITTQKEAEQDLQRSNSFIDKIVNTAPSAVYIYDLEEQRNVYFNNNIKGLLGFSPEEIKKMGSAVFNLLMHPDDIQPVAGHQKKLQTAGHDEVFQIQYRMKNKNGQYRILQTWDRVFEKLPDGKTKQIIGTVIDITDQKNAERLLKETTERYKLLSQATFEGISITKDGKIIDVNQQILNIFGYTREEIITAGIEKIVHPDDLALVLANIKNNLTEPYEHRGIKKDGSIIYLEVRANTVHFNDEVFRLTVIRDITARKLAEQALQSAEQKLRDILEHSTNMFYSHTADNELTYVSPQSYRFLGCSPEEAKQKWTTFVTEHTENQKGFQLTRAAIETGKVQQPYKLQLKTKDGRIIWVEVNEAPIVENGQTISIVGALTDITDRMLAEQALIESQERLDLTLKGADLGAWDFNVQTGAVIFNERWAEMLGYRLDEIKPHIDSWKTRVHPGDLPHALQILNDHLEGKTFFIEIEHRIQTKSGEWKWILKRGKVIEREAGGKPLRAVGTHLDITERKQAEAEKVKLETQLRRSQKLETIGTLAGGIAHDFNNILTPIMGYTDMALASLPEDDPLVSDLKQVLIGTTRAKDLVAQILTFSRQIEQEPRPLHLPALIEETLKLLRPSIPTTIEIRRLIDSACGKIYADPSQIHQVIINLCTNAFQAMEQKGGELTIELKQVTNDSAAVQLHPNLKQGDYARLTIHDTGPGMDETTLDRIFEPFFSTKPVGKGTGLGLSVVHGIVKSHRGEISAYSEKDKGATFHVYLPIMLEERETQYQETREIAGGNESILIVDDEKSVADVLKRMLERLGYTVEIKTSSPEGLKAFRKNPGKYDLVITDLTMPNMNGLQLAKSLSKTGAGIPVILITGYGEEISVQMQREYGIREILGKPIVLVELANAIRKVVAYSAVNKY